MRYAAIDIGSNAIKCMIGTVVETGYPIVIKELYARVPLRLGNDVFNSGEISKETEKNLLDSLKAFLMLIKSWQVQNTVVVATAAMRDAKNGKIIIEDIENKLGLKTWNIKGKVEAALISDLLKCLGGENIQKLIIDLGGGSTEITFLNTDEKNKSKSFQVGAVRSLLNKEKSDEFSNMIDFIHENSDNEQLLIASGGNINALKSHFGIAMSNYISFNELKNAHQKLSQLNVEDRVKFFLINPDRADVIVPAADIFLKIMKATRAEKIMVPKSGLPDALILMQYKGKTPEQY